jgi:hypothetical protein
MDKSTPETAVRLFHEDAARTSGRKGGYARVARQIGVSDETVRRWVHAAEAAPPVDELAYVDPPGGYPMPHPRDPLPQPATESPQDATDAAADMRDIIPLVSADESPQAATVLTPHATVATPERRTVVRRPGVPAQRVQVRWWRTLDVHPQVYAIIGAVILILLIFPH